MAKNNMQKDLASKLTKYTGPLHIKEEATPAFYNVTLKFQYIEDDYKKVIIREECIAIFSKYGYDDINSQEQIDDLDTKLVFKLKTSVKKWNFKWILVVGILFAGIFLFRQFASLSSLNNTFLFDKGTYASTAPPVTNINSQQNVNNVNDYHVKVPDIKESKVKGVDGKYDNKPSLK
jgi:hypothetical protein